MPLYKTIHPDNESQIYIWKITEDKETLLSNLNLNPNSINRLEKMKSNAHQLSFISIRKLLITAGYNDYDLHYDATGKPFLKNGKNISISHSNNFSAIIISERIVGIDIELKRNKIINIAEKFNKLDFSYLNKENESDYISKLTTLWGAKEAIFKICNIPALSYKNDIFINPFEMEHKKTIAQLKKEQLLKNFDIYFEEVENYQLVYAFEA